MNYQPKVTVDKPAAQQCAARALAERAAEGVRLPQTREALEALRQKYNRGR